MVCIDFGDFSNNPLSFGINFNLAENDYFNFFYFPGAAGLEMELGQWEELDNFYTNKSS
jgi:hypothetical protein